MASFPVDHYFGIRDVRHQRLNMFKLHIYFKATVVSHNDASAMTVIYIVQQLTSSDPPGICTCMENHLHQ